MASMIRPRPLEQFQAKEPRQKRPTHLQFISTLPCLMTGAYGVQAAHIRYGNELYCKRHTGLQEKPHDMWTVPLSPEFHTRQHSMNEELFWKQIGIDPLRVALLLFSRSGEEAACLTIIRTARANAFPTEEQQP